MMLQRPSLWRPQLADAAHLRVTMALLCLASLCGCGWNDVRKPSPAAANATKAVAAPLQHEVERNDGSKVRLADAYGGKALLIVNTASECGFTPQYAGLQQLYERYKGRGLEVLAFPSNDFGDQESGDAKAIATFCTSEFHVTFPLFAKVHARGEGIAPLYRSLSEATPDGINGPVKWNFTKFLIDPTGRVVARFEPMVEPLDERLLSEIEKVLPIAADQSAPLAPGSSNEVQL
jgi:glutathione peroxidase